MASIFAKEVIKLHGLPQSIISNKDKIFMSLFWGEHFKLQGTALKHSSSYHPRSDGQTEVVNRCLETYLRCFSFDKPHRWHKWLSWAEYWYNTSVHSTTNCTPFKALYSRDPPSMIRYEKGTATVSLVDQLLEDRDAILDDLRLHLLRAHQRMKKQADIHRHHEEFKVGDLVFIKLRPYRQSSLARRRFEKLSPRFYGPFQVLKTIGKVAYKLDLPQDARIHSTFYISHFTFLNFIRQGVTFLFLNFCLSNTLLIWSWLWNQNRS